MWVANPRDLWFGMRFPNIPNSLYSSKFSSPFPVLIPTALPLGEGDNAHVLSAKCIPLWRGSVVTVCAGRGRWFYNN